MAGLFYLSHLADCVYDKALQKFATVEWRPVKSENVLQLLILFRDIAEVLKSESSSWIPKICLSRPRLNLEFFEIQCHFLSILM